ncbi:rhoGEF domain-containing protein gxcJ-like isoform X2 [Calliphora vicina]|uniref:rhoGEF domain-containing protein gxcJ-like isoform X2 n=1 Tax=Calliphora vicina TaxID=7373 RepID=UPI00325B6A92
MNSTRDTKAAVKAQKKQQKLVKKQQLQKTKIETEQLNKNQKNALQTAKISKHSPTGTAINHNNNNINANNNNNNNNVNETNNNHPTNVSQKFREYYEQQQLQKQLIGGNSPTLLAAGPAKFERSGSFSLKGKLSKLINSITSSKESLNKIEDDSELPFKFTRSRSMILPRRTNRRSLIEPQLEQLSEEDPTSPASPRKNSIETNENNNTPLRPQSMSNQATSTPVECSPSQTRKSSTPILSQDAAFDPVANFKKRRSSTLISSFKTTFGLSSEKKKDKLNDKWRASLQSLQAVDNMVSYENMSFIDYDKFNTYEKQLERKLSQVSLMDPSLNSSIIPDNSLISDNSSYILPSPSTPSNATATSPFITPQTVVRRRKTSSSLHGSARELAKRRSASRNSFQMDPDYEHNLDKPRNVYRESLDSRKLELLNDISRNSYILDSDLVDILDLASTPLTATKRPYYKRCCSQTSAGRTKAGQDVVDAAVKVQLKSKSLTHLDGLESEMVCNPAKNSNNVSSSEYFSVSFCTESGCQDEEFFPATKGVTLANALSQSLRRRNLSFTQLTITDSNDNNQTPAFLEAGTSPLHTSLDENTEVENLAGHHLIIMDKDSSRKTLQKAASFGSRNRPPRLLSSASTDESSEVNLTGKQLKQRWSGLFGVKNPQQSQLCELLNSYSKNGVPQKTPAILGFDHPELENAINYLDNRHKTWMDIVESGSMNDSEMRIQTAIWELVTTEVDYIHCLQTVTDLFLACLEAVQEEGLLKEVDQHRLFANIRDICEANLKFWTFYLYPMVAHSINTREPLRVAFFQQGFIAFANIFAPYKKYCAEQSTCQFYCKELNRTNSLFTSYLAWCEAQKMCNRLRLADILVRPMQRLTKYSLLLAAIKKHMTDVEEIEAIETMLHTTENFVFSVNNHLTTRQENERLKGVMARIESYDVVDTNNEHLEKMIKQYSQMFDLCGPMKGCASQHVRHLFMEGDHKYKDNLGKVEVHCFLLTDMLLVCKSIAKKGLGTLKVIRQPYLTDRLIVQHSNNILSCVYLNEFQVAISAFTLQCTEAKNWYEALKRAKMIYTRLKQSSLVNPWDSMRFVGSTADSLGVKKSPMNSSICSHVTSANNSHSGSVEWNDSRNISVDFDKTNSLSSDEGCTFLGAHGFPLKGKPLTTISPQKLKVNTTSSSNMLTVQPLNHLGQSLPNLNLHHSHTNNTLLVPGTANSAHSGTLLLSPSHRGISYPPPSPTRVPLRRGMAFSNSIKNPPLLKTRNITSQNSINWHQIPATPTPTSPQSQQQAAAIKSSTSSALATVAVAATNPPVNTITEQQEQEQQQTQQLTEAAAAVATTTTTDCTGLQLTNNVIFSTQLSNSTETDV